MNGYTTIAHDSEVEIVIKKSRFIGRAIAASASDTAIAALEALRKQHWDASHNCYAYVLGEGSGVQRYADDGEPQGTAGQPILEVITRKGLTDVLVVVTRYFGGTLLGAGGLIRAYSQAAAEALDAAGARQFALARRLMVSCDYALWGKLEAHLQAADCVLEQTDFAAEITCTLAVRETQADAFMAGLVDAMNGRVELVEIETAMMGM